MTSKILQWQQNKLKKPKIWTSKLQIVKSSTQNIVFKFLCHKTKLYPAWLLLRWFYKNMQILWNLNPSYFDFYLFVTSDMNYTFIFHSSVDIYVLKKKLPNYSNRTRAIFLHLQKDEKRCFCDFNFTFSVLFIKNFPDLIYISCFRFIIPSNRPK